jgi:hypothetical protein
MHSYYRDFEINLLSLHKKEIVLEETKEENLKESETIIETNTKEFGED